MNVTSALSFILSFMRNYFTQNFPFHFSYTIYNCNTYHDYQNRSCILTCTLLATLKTGKKHKSLKGNA